MGLLPRVLVRSKGKNMLRALSMESGAMKVFSMSGTVIIALLLSFSSVQFSSVAQSCPNLCDPMNRSTPGLLVHHQLPGKP